MSFDPNRLHFLRPTLVFSFAAFAATLIGLPASADDRPWAERMFDTTKLDFGVLTRDGVAKRRIKITSLWRDDTHISDVRTTCGCSAAKPQKRTLKSRESTYIEVTMDTHKFTHRKDSNVIVTFDKPLHAEVRIPITAYILPDVTMKPSMAEFGSAEYGNKSERKITVTYNGQYGWALKGVKTDNKHLDVKLSRINKNGRIQYEVVVTLKESAPIGEIRDQVFLITDDRQAQRIPIIVHARVQPDITITPSLAALGRLKPGQKKTINLVIKGKKPIEIEGIDSVDKATKFETKLKGGKQPVHVIPFTMTAPEKPGRFDAEFSVRIAGRRDPITFKAYGHTEAAKPAVSAKETAAAKE